jgi:hypothetical protein
MGPGFKSPRLHSKGLARSRKPFFYYTYEADPEGHTHEEG